MPHYFFDVHAGDSFTRDENGVHYPDEETMQAEALAAAADIAKEVFLNGGRRVTIEVRQQQQQVLSLTLLVEIAPRN